MFLSYLVQCLNIWYYIWSRVLWNTCVALQIPTLLVLPKSLQFSIKILFSRVFIYLTRLSKNLRLRFFWNVNWWSYPVLSRLTSPGLCIAVHTLLSYMYLLPWINLPFFITSTSELIIWHSLPKFDHLVWLPKSVTWLWLWVLVCLWISDYPCHGWCIYILVSFLCSPWYLFLHLSHISKFSFTFCVSFHKIISQYLIFAVDIKKTF